MTHDLYERNLDAFRAHFPQLAEKLEQISEPVSRIIWSDGQAVNIDLGSGTLYPEDAAVVAARQVKQHAAKPKRVFLNRPSAVGLQSRVSIDITQAMAAQLGKWRISSLPGYPVTPSGVLIVIGIGLGTHIEPLVRATDAPAVVLVEQMVEFIHHSMLVIDWAALIAEMAAQGRTLHIVQEDRADHLYDAFHRTIGAQGMPFLDGSHVFIHYAGWVLQEVHDRFQNDLHNHFIARGFFEDELRMMTNATANLLQRDFRLLEPKPLHSRKEPVFIAAAGPSLDRDIEVLRKWRQHVVLISCGTGLRALLRNGLRPDLHVEIENQDLNHEVLSAVDAEFGLSGIRLAASLTVVSPLSTLFDEVYLFFRDSVSSSRTLGADFRILQGAAPTVANTALAAATAFGFREIYLFGVDCGAKESGAHHARDTVYHDGKDERLNFKRPFTIVRDGNFGGQIRTDWIYDLTRLMLEKLRRIYRGQFYNCSDGARIHGFTPKVSQAVRFTHAPLDHARIFAQLAETQRHFAPAAFFDQFPTDRLVGEYDAFEAAVVPLRGRLLTGAPEMRAFAQAVGETLDATRELTTPWAMMNASMRNLVAIGFFFVNRVEDPEIRAAFYRAFVESYFEQVDSMLRQGRDLVEALHRSVSTSERP